MRSIVLLLPLLCESVVASKLSSLSSSRLGYRDEDFVITAPLSNAESDIADSPLHHAISILREAVAAPPAILALGSIVVIQQISRKFRRALSTRKRSTLPNDPPLESTPRDTGLKLGVAEQTDMMETLQGADVNSQEELKGQDYELLYKDLAGQHEDAKERWKLLQVELREKELLQVELREQKELLQVELREQKAYWEARASTQEYQNELAVKKLGAAMVGMLEEEKAKLQQSFHKQAEELRLRLERNSNGIQG